MPVAKITTFDQESKILDRALDGNGIKVTLQEPGGIFRLRFRLYACRSAYRELTKKMYDVDAPEYNTSPWENLTMIVLDKEGKPAGPKTANAANTLLIQEKGTYSGGITIEDLEITPIA